MKKNYTPYLPGLQPRRSPKNQNFVPPPDAFAAVRSFLSGKIDFADLARQTKRKRLYDLSTTFILFLLQTLLGMSCAETVKFFQAVNDGRKISSDTGGYCKARTRLMLEAIQSACSRISRIACDAAPNSLWHGMRVMIVDGTGLDAPDTKRNRKKYPPRAEKVEGTSFPQLNLLVLVDWASGAVIEWARGDKHWGEQSLLKKLFGRACFAKCILLGDKYYGSYGNMAYLIRKGGHFIFPLKSMARMTRKERLSNGDWLYELEKPLKRAESWSKSEWATMPRSIKIRVIEICVERKGYRVKKIKLASDLLSPKLYPAADIAILSAQRWRVELDLRSLKTHMGMDHLKTLSPKMIDKEIAMFMTAYNLIRAFMSEAGRTHQICLSRMSFAQAKSQLAEWLKKMSGKQRKSSTARKIQFAEYLVDDLLKIRPGRAEPRVIKRRPKSFPRLTKNRKQYKEYKVA